jgi:hypothetical protein
MRRALLALPAVFLLAACDPSTVVHANPMPISATTPSGRLAVGQGPQAHYTVQTQPPAGACHYGREQDEPLPDRSCTPGAVSPAVTQADIRSTICRSGYTRTVRPPVSVTGREKQANGASYSFTGFMRKAEYDHLLSGVVTVHGAVCSGSELSGMPLTRAVY